MSAKDKPMLFGNMDLDGNKLDMIAKFEDQGFDWSYVPVYSEQRIINEHAVRDGKKPKPMPKLYWARSSRVDGSDVDLREAVTVQRLGYRACTLQDLDDNGWGMPPAAVQAADGTIRHMDTVLAIVDYDRAEKNKKKQAEINAKFEGNDPTPDAPNATSKIEKSGQGVSLNKAFEALSNPNR